MDAASHREDQEEMPYASVAISTTACPYCGGLVPHDATICPDCQEDLAALVRLEMLYAIHYNEALGLARRGRLDEARDRCASSLAERADFVPALRLMARICALRGDWTAARRHALLALDEAPKDPSVRRLVTEVERGARSQEGAPRPVAPAVAPEAPERDTPPTEPAPRQRGRRTLLGALRAWLVGGPQQ